MKTFILIILCIFIFSSCSSSWTRSYTLRSTCVEEKLLIHKTYVLWKSWDDSSQAGGTAWGLYVWFVSGAIMWWPIGAAIGAVVWGLSGWGLASLDTSTDYEAHTDKWVFTCQATRCRSLI